MPRPLFAPRRPAAAPIAADPLTDLTVPFANPGTLRMRTFVPVGLPTAVPLVVVLHGCTQTAAGYDHAAGWSALATANRFALLFPEQVRANNPNGCFNWFESNDIRRGSGEVASIAAAVAAMVAAYRLDPSRVFVTGLSAGGAMANALLATYPDVFAGGAIIAGLPFGVAHGVGEAMATMANPPALSGPELGDKVRDASTFTGPWPRVSVWHGDDDRTVSRRNGAAIAAQWSDVHGGIAGVDGMRQVWRNAAGVAVVELNEIKGMGHGTPIDSAAGGVPAPFMLDVGIASSAHIAAFWGLGAAVVQARSSSGAGAVRAQYDGGACAVPPRGKGGPAKLDVGELIGSVLRAAGVTK